MTNTPTSRVTELTARELDRFAASHPRSGEIRDAAEEVLLSGVPMNWMTRWPGAWPVVFETAEGARLTDADGNTYVDFCLGDTGAMAGHSPPRPSPRRRRGWRRGSRRCCRARTPGRSARR